MDFDFFGSEPTVHREQRPFTAPLQPTFNPEQSMALAYLEDFVFGNSELQLACLLGAAGTGKSFTLQELIREALDRGLSVIMTAPTHKAVKVLLNHAARFGLFGVEFGTIQSLCGVKPEIDDVTGHRVFKVDPNGECSIRQYDLVIVDEASMVNENLYSFICEAIRGAQTRVIFSGDHCQVPPVGEDDSRTFEIEDTVTLTQVMRHTGPGVKMVNGLRDVILDGGIIPEPEEDYEGERGVWVYKSEAAWLERFLRDIKSTAWKDSSDYARVIAYTNSAVEAYNEAAHQAIYGDSADAYERGQRLVANSPVFEGENIVMQNSTEAVVRSARRTKWDGFQAWKLNIRTDDWVILDLIVLDTCEKAKFRERCEQLKKIALGCQGFRRKTAWRDFYNFQQKFADLERLYALTIHKAQGSTFNRTYVDLRSCERCRSYRERKRLIYTAYTRFSEQLVVLN